MEKLNKQMDDALNTKEAALNATDDETGDGKVDALDLKHQLDRVEAQLELQDQQNRALLRSQKRLLWAAIAIVVVLCLIMGGLLLRFNTAYNQVITTCAQVNEIAGTLQDSLAKLDTEQLDSMMQTLPDIADKLSQIDVDARFSRAADLPVHFLNRRSSRFHIIRRAGEPCGEGIVTVFIVWQIDINQSVQLAQGLD